MTKKILFLFMLLTAATISQAQSAQADTFYLSVYNTGARIEITPAEFGGKVTENILGTMVRAFDTVMVLKANGAIDSTGKKRIRHEAERRADKISKGIKDKIVVMELNKDVDVTQTCINVQRGGAKAIILVHTSNKKEDIKLKYLGIYKDSVRIPCFTVRNALGDSLWSILPSVAGIKAPTLPPVQSLAVNNNPLLGMNTQATPHKTTGAEPINNSSDKVNTNESFNLGKIDPVTGKFEEDVTLYPNPTADVLNLTFKGYTGQAVDIVIFDMQGKSILTEHLGQLQSHLHSIFIGDKTVAGQYMIRIRTKGKRDVFRTFMVGK